MKTDDQRISCWTSGPATTLIFPSTACPKLFWNTFATISSNQTISELSLPCHMQTFYADGAIVTLLDPHPNYFPTMLHETITKLNNLKMEVIYCQLKKILAYTIQQIAAFSMVSVTVTITRLILWWSFDDVANLPAGNWAWTLSCCQWADDRLQTINISLFHWFSNF